MNNGKVLSMVAFNGGYLKPIQDVAVKSSKGSSNGVETM